MKFIKLFTADDSKRAVSPVIGVILMVAITVILAAVIGTFVLGLGDQVQQTSPNAQWDWDEGSSGGNPTLDLIHQGGDSVNVDRLEVSNSGSNIDKTCTSTSDGWGSSEVTAGTTCNVVTGGGTSVAGTYRLIWTAEGGGQSSTLSTYEA